MRLVLILNIFVLVTSFSIRTDKQQVAAKINVVAKVLGKHQNIKIPQKRKKRFRVRLKNSRRGGGNTKTA